MSGTVSTEALLTACSSRAVDVDGTGRVLVRSDRTGTWQLYELDAGGGELRALTDLADHVDGCYVRGRRAVILSADQAGDERHQLYLFDPDGPAVTDLAALRPVAVAPGFVHHPAGTTGDGRFLAYTSNRRNGVDFDAWVADLDGVEEDRCVWSGGGWAHPGSGWSPDHRWFSLLLSGPRPLDNALVLVEAATGAVTEIDAHPDTAATVGPPVWLDAGTLAYASDLGRDTTAVVRLDLASGDRQVLAEGPWPLAVVGAGPGDSTVLVLANEDGVSTGRFVDARSGADLGGLPLPEPGVCAQTHLWPDPHLAADATTVTFTFSSPTRPAEVWRHDRPSAELTACTTSPGAIHPSRLATPERHRIRSFDGEELSVYLFRPLGPAGSGRVPDPEALQPVTVLVHGGPESQSLWSWAPLVQALVAAGVAVAVPNVRGSTGYGRRFAGLDDTVKRLDSVADLAAIHDWLPAAGLDPGRAALFGGSYGGYMTLAGCAFQPERWTAGVDEVGMSSLVSFLEHTSPYRRHHRELEYGSLAEDREFLAAASPLTRVDDIRASLFVIHGANDPRVPLSETEQLVASLRARGVDCELRVYPDEGHGLARLANRLDAYPAAITWLAAALGCAASSASGTGLRTATQQ